MNIHSHNFFKKSIFCIALFILPVKGFSFLQELNTDSIEQIIDTYPEELHDSLYYVAGVYAYSFNTRYGYYQALHYYMKALEISMKYDNLDGIEKAYFGIGSVHDANNNGKEAVHYYKLAHYGLLNRFPDDYKSIARSYFNIAIGFLKSDDNNSAKIYADSIDKILPLINDEEEIAKNKLLISNIMYSINDTTEFLYYFESIPKNIQFKNAGLSYGWHFAQAKSRYHLIKGDKDKALQPLIDQLQFTKDSITALRIIINTAAEIQDYKAAHHYQLMMNDLDQRIINRDMYEDINFRLLQADNLLKAKDNELLAINKDKVEQKFRVTQFFLICVLILIAFSYYFLNKIQKQNKQLRLRNIEIKKQNEINNLMFKELHHRVKNNLQIIVSLIELQSIKDNSDSPALNEIKIKIDSMKIAHQMMYACENMENVMLNEYFQKLMCANLKTFGIQGDKVNLNIELGTLSMSLDHIIPFAISISEMLTNTVKYVINGSNEICSIALLAEVEEDNIVISYKDSGNKSAKRTDSNGDGMGLRLVKRLSKQIDAKLVVSDPLLTGYYEYKYYFKKEAFKL